MLSFFKINSIILVGKVNDLEEMGMIPRLCREIFSRISENRENQQLKYTVEVKAFLIKFNGISNLLGFIYGNLL